MKRLLVLFILFTMVGGCAGTGFEKRTTLVPDSVTIGYAQEQFAGDLDAWYGFTASATWRLK